MCHRRDNSGVLTHPARLALFVSTQMNKLLAELLGTFFLVFAGTGAIVINDTHGGSITHVGIALTFGLVVLALVYALGDCSGCHLNPAVTIGFALAGRFSYRQVPGYVAQLR
jgi:aquaporin Z